MTTDDLSLHKRASAGERVARQGAIGMLRSALGAVPFVGTLLNEALFDVRSRIKQERLEEFITKLAEELDRLGQSAVDAEYLSTDEFSDRLEDILVRVSRQRHEERRQRLRQVLLRALGGERAVDFEPMFLSVVDETTEDELGVLTRFIKYGREARKRAADEPPLEIGAISYDVDQIDGFAPSEFRLLVQSLVRRGLLFDDSHGRWTTPPWTFVKPTDLGLEFADWLEGLPLEGDDR